MSSSPLLFFSFPLIFFLQLALLMYVIFSFSLSSILLHFFISPDLIPLAPLHFSPYLLPFSFLSVLVLFYFSISSIFSSLIFSFSFPPSLPSFLPLCLSHFVLANSVLVDLWSAPFSSPYSPIFSSFLSSSLTLSCFYLLSSTLRGTQLQQGPAHLPLVAFIKLEHDVSKVYTPNLLYIHLYFLTFIPKSCPFLSRSLSFALASYPLHLIYLSEFAPSRVIDVGFKLNQFKIHI